MTVAEIVEFFDNNCANGLDWICFRVWDSTTTDPADDLPEFTKDNDEIETMLDQYGNRETSFDIGHSADGFAIITLNI